MDSTHSVWARIRLQINKRKPQMRHNVDEFQSPIYDWTKSVKSDTHFSFLDLHIGQVREHYVIPAEKSHRRSDSIGFG